MAIHYTSLAGEPGQHSSFGSSCTTVEELADRLLILTDVGNDPPRPAETKGIHLHHLCLRIKVCTVSVLRLLHLLLLC